MVSSPGSARALVALVPTAQPLARPRCCAGEPPENDALVADRCSLTLPLEPGDSKTLNANDEHGPAEDRQAVGSAFRALCRRGPADRCRPFSLPGPPFRDRPCRRTIHPSAAGEEPARCPPSCSAPFPAADKRSSSGSGGGTAGFKRAIILSSMVSRVWPTSSSSRRNVAWPRSSSSSRAQSATNDVPESDPDRVRPLQPFQSQSDTHFRLLSGCRRDDRVRVQLDPTPGCPLPSPAVRRGPLPRRREQERANARNTGPPRHRDFTRLWGFSPGVLSGLASGPLPAFPGGRPGSLFQWRGERAPLTGR